MGWPKAYIKCMALVESTPRVPDGGISLQLRDHILASISDAGTIGKPHPFQSG